jgi:hypothetical protein
MAMTSLVRKTIHVIISMSNGSLLKGVLTIERSERLSDMLNKYDKHFLALVDYDGKVHLLNRQHIVEIMENEEQEQATKS